MDAGKIGQAAGLCLEVRPGARRRRRDSFGAEVRDPPAGHRSRLELLNRRRRAAQLGHGRVVAEVGVVDSIRAGEKADAADRYWQAQPTEDQRGHVHVIDVCLAPVSGKAHTQAEPALERQLDRRPEASARVQLPRTHVVEHGRVLDRVGVARLVRSDEERLVRVAVDAPGQSGKARSPLSARSTWIVPSLRLTSPTPHKRRRSFVKEHA